MTGAKPRGFTGHPRKKEKSTELKNLIESLRDYRIGDNLTEGLIEYIMNGRPTGGFLEAVLSNDLMGSYARADMWSRESMGDVVKWLYNNSPAGCYGSKEKYLQWIEEQGLNGLNGVSK